MPRDILGDNRDGASVALHEGCRAEGHRKNGERPLQHFLCFPCSLLYSGTGRPLSGSHSPLFAPLHILKSSLALLTAAVQLRLLQELPRGSQVSGELCGMQRGEEVGKV